ncbi:MAG: hypothetical protein D6683_17250 [Actinomyces sp.]|nr:MAG: hypothetical protein D6683_17250 [Actinomyces sp.]
MGDDDPPLEPDDDPTAAVHADVDELARWSAEARIEEAVRARRRVRNLVDQHDGDVTVGTVLAGLAEQGGPVRVSTRHGHVLDGRVTALGRDHVVVTDRRQGRVFVPFASVAAVRDRAPAESGARPAADGVTPALSSLVGVLADLAAEQTRVRVVLASDDIRGRLTAVGSEVLVLEVTTLGRERVHVAVSAVDHLIVTP